ncbi:MAG: V-type ATP synthase subunit F [Bacillota bacterium]|nr:V-type ATP synthase subunit F [Bacillota bacterium]
MKMYLISDNIDTKTGLRLAGIEGVIVHNQDEFESALTSALSDKDIGILLITEKLCHMWPERVNNIRLTRKLPLIVETPDRHGVSRQKDFIASYVNEAIGLKL